MPLFIKFNKHVVDVVMVISFYYWVKNEGAMWNINVRVNIRAGY